MARDLEDFLRRAAQRRNQQPQRQPMQEPVVDLEVVDEQRSIASSSSTSRRPISSQRKSTQRTSSHGESDSYAVDQADERMDDHLHESFDHGLGNLGAPTESLTASSPEREDQATESVIHDLLALLSQPTGAQQAILLKEILDRPIDRWE